MLSARLEALDGGILGKDHILEPGYAAFAVMQIASSLVRDDLGDLIQWVIFNAASSLAPIVLCSIWCWNGWIYSKPHWTIITYCLTMSLFSVTDVRTFVWQTCQTSCWRSGLFLSHPWLLFHHRHLIIRDFTWEDLSAGWEEREEGLKPRCGVQRRGKYD